jgi:hypothetical protein
MTFTIAPASWHTRVTAWISSFTVSKSPDRNAPTLITISISRAPARNAAAASATLASVEVAPSGNPATVQTFTAVPASSLAASGTQYGLMHTVAKPYCRASPHSLTISARVASGRSMV